MTYCNNPLREHVCGVFKIVHRVLKESEREREGAFHCSVHESNLAFVCSYIIHDARFFEATKEDAVVGRDVM